MQLADAFRFVQKGEQASEAQRERSDLNFEEQVSLAFTVNEHEWASLIVLNRPDWKVRSRDIQIQTDPTRVNVPQRTSIKNTPGLNEPCHEWSENDLSRLIFLDDALYM